MLLNLNFTLSKVKPFVAEEDIIVKVRSCNTKYNKFVKYKKALILWDWKVLRKQANRVIVV